MKKFKPMLLVMIAAYLMFTSSAFANSSKVDVTKHENESFVQSEKLYTDGEEVELNPYMLAAGNAEVYVLFEDLESDRTRLMSKLVLTPEMKGLSILSTHRNSGPGYYYIQIRGDYNAYVSARLKK